MTTSSTYPLIKPLFPSEEESVDAEGIINKNSIDIDLEAQPYDSAEQQAALDRIESIDRKLSLHFHNKIKVQSTLTRQLVSFQANKPRPAYRWYKYKEAFSAALIEYIFSTYGITSGKVLDPFAGSGTALFAASESGVNAEGIELLLIGQQIILSRVHGKRVLGKGLCHTQKVD